MSGRVNYTTHKDRPIGLETAKLLGLPITWLGSTGWAHVAIKYVATDDGLKMLQRSLKYPDIWHKSEAYLEDLREHIVPTCEVYLVTFHDEED